MKCRQASHSCLPSCCHACRSSDLEFEMDRFTEALAAVHSKYTYMERPRGSAQQQVSS